MMIVLSILCVLSVIFVFGICLQLSQRINNVDSSIDSLEKNISYLEQKVELNKESIELQTKCIKDLNGIVKRTVKDKETAEPDTKVLISGWDADEPELLQQLISKEEWMQLVKANLNCQRIEPLPQQCILPWQQTPTGAILPLWYMNRRLEDM